LVVVLSWCLGAFFLFLPAASRWCAGATKADLLPAVGLGLVGVDAAEHLVPSCSVHYDVLPCRGWDLAEEEVTGPMRRVLEQKTKQGTKRTRDRQDGPNLEGGGKARQKGRAASAGLLDLFSFGATSPGHREKGAPAGIPDKAAEAAAKPRLPKRASSQFQERCRIASPSQTRKTLGRGRPPPCTPS
jgi:hypothetical protein